MTAASLRSTRGATAASAKSLQNISATGIFKTGIFNPGACAVNAERVSPDR
jgi:hypothetical protein